MGIVIGVIWADTSDVAGAIAVVTTIVGGIGIVGLLIALGVLTWRQRQAAQAASGTPRTRKSA